MSTSCKPAREGGRTVQPFTYLDPSAVAHDKGPASTDPSFDQVREEARRLGREEAEQAYSSDLAKVREAIRTAVESFAKERQNYFDEVEAEVVQLALAIARRVLEREVESDPLVLGAMVKVALTRIACGSKITLRVSAEEVSKWSTFFGAEESSIQPEILGDPSLAPQHCRIETSMGSTDLSIAGQLQEIEKSFSQLLGRKPRGLQSAP